MKYIYLIIFAFSIVSCNNTPYVQGKRLFAANCANCHMEDGSGLGELIPPLNKSTLLGQASIVCIVKNGIKDTLFKDSTYLLKEMPSFSHLSATEVTNIINFINYKWQPSFKEITILDVEQALKTCQ
ncbi:MAG TPA: cytochrome c [Saprospiraceae bacterium]|nr:cytochrome c [Saprospiraceae bacterium]